MNIGENIRQARLKKGLSQENMADALHLSTTAYGDIERNKSEISVNRLLKISKILDVEYNILIENKLSNENADEIFRLKAELLLANIESARWKERFLRTVLTEKPERKRIGFK
jgi:XRE family transcriptional regulator, regulator of sulfur utilization